MTIELFEVGGSIRDSLLGVESDDRDFVAVAADWESFESWCHAKMKKVFLTNKEYGVIRGVMTSGKAIDVAFLKQTHDKPWMVVWDNLRTRDLTINAMAQQVDPLTLDRIGEIIDPRGGKGHIEMQVIRPVSLDNIVADKVRMLRVIRFSLKLGWDMDPQLSSLLRVPRLWEELMQETSEERIRQELAKLLKIDPAGAMMFLSSCGALEHLFSGKIGLSTTISKR